MKPIVECSGLVNTPPEEVKELNMRLINLFIGWGNSLMSIKEQILSGLGFGVVMVILLVIGMLKTFPAA